MNELSWNKRFYENNKKNNSRFATRRFCTLPESLAPINGPTSIAIVSWP